MRDSHYGPVHSAQRYAQWLQAPFRQGKTASLRRAFRAKTVPEPARQAVSCGDRQEAHAIVHASHRMLESANDGVWVLATGGCKVWHPAKRYARNHVSALVEGGTAIHGDQL
jgi:hypothetical protein